MSKIAPAGKVRVSSFLFPVLYALRNRKLETENSFEPRSEAPEAPILVGNIWKDYWIQAILRGRIVLELFSKF